MRKKDLVLKLKHFDMSRIQHTHVVIAIARRGGGKSFIVRDLLSHHTSIPAGMVISPTESSNGFFGEMVPSIFIHHEWDPKLVENLIKRQRLITAKANEEKKLGMENPVDPRAFLILDDCMYDKRWATDKNIKFAFMNGRHVHMLTVITMQYPLGMPPNLRGNADFVFILQESNVSNRRKIYENYAGMFPSFDAFEQVMSQTTRNYECLVIDNTVKSNELSDQIFWYKAEDQPPFKTCSDEYWVLSDQISRPVSDPETEIYDINEFKKVTHAIKVVKS